MGISLLIFFSKQFFLKKGRLDNFMRKIIHKFIFVFVLVSFCLLMWPQVKALEQDFAPTLIKTTFVRTYYETENEQTHEFVAEYKIDGIIINNLQRGEYFLVAKTNIAIVNGYYYIGTNTATLEDIEIRDNSTTIYVRTTLTHSRVDSYGGVENINEFFINDSAFYVSYDAYDLGYNDGYIDGYNDGTGLPNGSEVKFYNLVWVEKATWGDTTSYDLVVEIEPGNYEPINAILTYESEFLKLYGVVVFNYPRILDTEIDTKSIYYQKNPNSEYQAVSNVDFIAAKKMSNKLEIYLNTTSGTHTLDYYEGLSDFGGNRTTYYIPELTYEDGYEDGYDVGYGEGLETGKTLADEYEFTRGYNSGYSVGYDKGYNKGISENLESGGFGLMLKNVFTSVGSFLEIELLPGIPFGAIIAVPIVFGIIAFILGRRS